MNKKITLVILSLLLPFTFILFYTLDRNDSKSEKRVIDEPSEGSGSKKSEGKNKNDIYETPDLIKVVINDLSKEMENRISMSVGHIIVFEENITESMITYPKDIFTLIRGESSTGASSITLTANFAASAQIFVEFDNNKYQLLLEIEGEKKLPEREFNLDAGVKKSQEVIASIINKPIGEALAIIKKAEVKHRIVSEDGLSYAVTMDYSPSRINLVLINDIVQDATLG
jgi:hypothetical protein